MSELHDRPSEKKGTDEQKKPDMPELLKHIFLRNWGFKLVSVLLALILWAGLITQDPTLTREKVFTDVAVTISGTDTIKRNGFIVTSDMQSLLSNVTVHADVPQGRYSEATVNAYNVRVDLTRVNAAGEWELKLSATNSSIYGTVTEITPSTIPVTVEAYTTRYRIPVALSSEGEVPEGWSISASSVDPSLISVSGPRSVVDQIVRARAVIDLSTLPQEEGVVSTAVPFTLIDRQGEAVSSDLIEVTSESILLDSVIVEMILYPTKTMDFSSAGLIAGAPAEGYEIKSVTYTPATVTASGSSEDLDVLDELFASSAIDVTGLSEGLVRTVKVRKPSELVSLSPDSVTVEIDIGPVISSRTFSSLRVNLEGVDASLRASMEVSNISVTVTGPQLWLDDLKSSSIHLVCDASGLAAGSYELPVSCTITGAEDAGATASLSQENIYVTLTSRN